MSSRKGRQLAQDRTGLDPGRLGGGFRLRAGAVLRPGRHMRLSGSVGPESGDTLGQRVGPGEAVLEISTTQVWDTEGRFTVNRPLPLQLLSENG